MGIAVGGGLFRGGRRFAACLRRRRGCLHRPGARRGELPATSEPILAAAQATGAEAIHPGYGFLSENADFAEACAAAGIAFIGPTPEQMRAFGLKHTARALAGADGVPLAARHRALDDAAHAQARGATHRLSGDAQEHRRRRRHRHAALPEPKTVAEAFARSRAWRAATSTTPACSSKNTSSAARHIEVQIFGDGRGKVVALGERDCSLQRRNQKVIEETPAPGLPDRERAALNARRRAARRGGALPLAPAPSSSSTTPSARVLLPRGQYAAAGRARRHRRGHRRRPRRVDGARRPPERLIVLDSGRIRAAHRSRPASTPRTPRATSARQSGCSPKSRFPPDARVETWVEDGDEVSRLLRSAAREAHRARRRTGAMRWRGFARRWRKRASPASRPISTICAASRRPHCSRAAA